MKGGTSQRRIQEGIAHFARKDFPAAVGAFRTAARLEPENATAWKGLGYALTANGLSEEAAQALGRSVAIDPHDPDSRFGFGMALLAAGKTDRALEQLGECVGLDPENRTAQEAFTNLALEHGRQLLDQGLIPNALHWFRATVETDPACVDGHIELIRLLVDDGQLTEAKILFERLADRRPDLPELDQLASSLGLVKYQELGWY